MAVIFSYPIKSTPDNDDLILISDGTDKLTKQVRVSSLPGGSSSGVSSFNTLTGNVTITGGTNVTLNPVGNNIEINASGGTTVVANPGNATSTLNTITIESTNYNVGTGTVTGTGTQNTLTKWSASGTGIEDSSIVDTGSIVSIGNPTVLKGDGTTNGASSSLKFNCSNNSHYVEVKGPLHTNGSQYGVRLPQAAPGNQQILQSDASGNLSWINTPSSGGGGSVDSIQATDGTFIDLSPNNATTGAVTVTADLSATGTAGNTTFLRGDNQWAVPSYTAPGGSSTQFQYNNGGSFNGTDTLRFDADKIQIGIDGQNPTRGQIVMYGDGTDASDIQLYNSTNDRFLTLAQQAGATQDLTLTFPGQGPGGNDKILESDSSGQLSWIDTPTGTTYSAMNNSTLGLGKLKYATNNTPAAQPQSTIAGKTYGITANASNQLVVNVPWEGGGGSVGFSPISIYEGTDEVGVSSISPASAVTFARQTVVENECTIDSVDFFRLTGVADISVHVFEGTIADAANAQLVLSGTESGGTQNEINSINFSKPGYTTHSFAAGRPVVILVSFNATEEPNNYVSNALGDENLYRTPNLSRLGYVYYNVNNIPNTLDDAIQNLEDGNRYGVCLHFYKS